MRDLPYGRTEESDDDGAELKKMVFSKNPVKASVRKVWEIGVWGSGFRV